MIAVTTHSVSSCTSTAQHCEICGSFPITIVVNGRRTNVRAVNSWYGSNRTTLIQIPLDHGFNNFTVSSGHRDTTIEKTEEKDMKKKRAQDRKHTLGALPHNRKNMRW